MKPETSQLASMMPNPNLWPLPTGMERPSAVLLAAAGSAAFLAARYYYDKKEPSAYYNFPNPEALENVLPAGVKTERRRRLTEAGLAIAGVTLAIASINGQPYNERPTQDDAAQTVLIVDRSTTMNLSRDVDGMPRSEAVTQAFAAIDQDALPQNLAIIQMGAKAAITSPNVTNTSREIMIGAISDQAVDQNGTNLSEALSLAQQIIPKSDSKKTIIIFTDGTVQNSSEELKSQSAALEESGISTEVIIVGTPQASYELAPGAPKTESGIQPDNLRDFDDSINTVSSQQALNEEITKVLQQSDKTKTKRYWNGMQYLGLAAAAYGLLRTSFRGIFSR